ncbi:hypothetical protein QQP08_010541 [Theobroma cacao]|nr:hypothetical protein QQP08_010541 [Theobroma cacao]
MKNNCPCKAYLNQKQSWNGGDMHTQFSTTHANSQRGNIEIQLALHPQASNSSHVFFYAVDILEYARTFAFFYTIGLHILVFTCLYRMSALSYLSNGPEEALVGEKNVNLPRGF